MLLLSFSVTRTLMLARSCDRLMLMLYVPFLCCGFVRLAVLAPMQFSIYIYIYIYVFKCRNKILLEKNEKA